MESKLYVLSYNNFLMQNSILRDAEKIEEQLSLEFDSLYLNEAVLNEIKFIKKLKNSFNQGIDQAYNTRKDEFEKKGYSREQHKKDARKGLKLLGGIGAAVIAGLTVAGIAIAKALKSDKKKLESLEVKYAKNKDPKVKEQIDALKEKIRQKEEKLKKEKAKNKK
jgi:hypothetical protein